MNRWNKVFIVIIIIMIFIIAFMLVSDDSGLNEASAVVYVGDASFLNYQDTADHLCSVWCGRIFGFGVLMLGFACVYMYYSYKFEVLDAQTDIEIKRIEALENPLKVKEKQIQIVPMNTRRQLNNGDDIMLGEGIKINKKMLIEFVTSSLEEGGPGLAIGKWKAGGWDQKVVEDILDYMGELSLVTERANGRACQYTGDYDSSYVLRTIAGAQ
jgi:hypothetical protein